MIPIRNIRFYRAHHITWRPTSGTMDLSKALFTFSAGQGEPPAPGRPAIAVFNTDQEGPGFCAAVRVVSAGPEGVTARLLSIEKNKLYE